MNNYRILLVEDDQNLGSVLSEFLTLKNFNVDLAENGEVGYEKFSAGGYDLCLLDIMMPKKDGFVLAKDIRKNNKDIPIIFLTAKSMQHDKIEGLKIGADDYITKPFNTEELLLRINAVLRRIKRKKVKDNERIIIGSFLFDYNKRLLIYNSNKQKLTSKENELLKLLCDNTNQVVTREMALKSIWNEDTYFTSRSMDVYITKLRNYLKHDNNIEIMNIHGVGFKLVVN